MAVAGTTVGPVSISQWAIDLLTEGGWQVNNTELTLGIVAWALAENVHLGQVAGAEWNPLDTTQPAPGDSYFNSFGPGGIYHVRNYPDEVTGLNATVQTINNGDYPGIAAVLKSATATADDLDRAVGATGWGTSGSLFSDQVKEIRASPDGYYNRTVTGSAPVGNVSGLSVPAPSTTAPNPAASQIGVAQIVNPQYNSTILAPTAGFQLAIPGFGDIAVSDIIINGASLSADVTGAVTDVIFQRSINNASTATVVLTDPQRTIVRSGLFQFGDILTLDGLRFALVEIIKAGDQLELVFEALGVVALRQQYGALATTADLSAFAQYLVRQANAANPGLGMGFVGEPNPTLLATLGTAVGRGTNTDISEDSWTCLVRLAASAGWRVWESDNSIYLGSDAFFLTYGPPAGPIREFTEAVQLIDYALALDTPVPTPSGWTTMGDIRHGDQVFGTDGQPCRVLRTSPVHLNHDCYEVVFDDGNSIVADATHLWETECRRAGGRGVYTTREIAESLRDCTPGCYNHRLAVASALETSHAELPIDPYILGYWLGDGTSRCAAITVGKEDLQSLLQQIENAGYYHSGPKPDNSAWRVIVSTAPVRVTRHQDSLTQRLRLLGLLQNKHIPTLFLRASYGQRLALLQGLMDSDGSTGNGNVVFYSANERLARDVLELVQSLGLRPYLTNRPAILNSKDCGTQYRVVFAPRGNNVFRLQRKANKYRPTSERQQYRSIRDVRPVDSVPVRCITVDTKDHLYLVGRNMVPTHNTWDYGQPFGNLTVTAMSSLWNYPPGQAVLVAGCGIADGNWLVSDMQRSIYHPQASVQLMAPMTPSQLIAQESGTQSNAPSVLNPGSPSTGTPSISVTIFSGVQGSAGETVNSIAAGSGFSVQCVVSGDGLGWTPTGTVAFQSANAAGTGGDIIAGASHYDAAAVPLDATGTALITVPNGYGAGTFSITCSYTPATNDRGAPPGGTTSWQAVSSPAVNLYVQ